jgi:putative ABC transport system permease protein
MPGVCLLAWRYIAYYRARTCLLIAAITLTFFVPLATRWTIERFESRAMERASSTPLVIGVKGSRFGLAMHALYFRGESLEPLPQAQLRRIEETMLAKTIPLLVRFRARGFSIVGTTDAYSHFRELSVERGERLQRLGDCLLGATVASRLGLVPGDRLVSEPENMFDLSGPSPLNMRVTGVLRPTGSPDDEIVLCDLRTTWIMHGIGHGHSVTKGPTDTQGAHSDSDSHRHNASRENLTASAEVTDENLQTFHFHGPSDTFPLSAIIAIPDSARSEALLIGKYLSPDEPYQIIRPVDVVDELMRSISQIRRLFDWLALLLAVVTILLVGLVVMLSIRLRRAEIRTMSLLGSSRTTIAGIVLAELSIVIAISLVLAVILALAASSGSDMFVSRLATIQSPNPAYTAGLRLGERQIAVSQPDVFARDSFAVPHLRFGL